MSLRRASVVWGTLSPAIKNRNSGRTAHKTVHPTARGNNVSVIVTTHLSRPERERMGHRERVLAALDHRETDRVPIDYWAVEETTQRLQAHLGLADQEALLRYLGVDLRTIQGPSYVGQEIRTHADGTVEDLWGARRRPVTVEGKGYTWTYKQLVDSPLAAMTTVQEIEDYGKWSSPDWWDYSHIAEDCEKHRGYAVVIAGDRLDRTAQLKPAMYLRGMEQFYVDLKRNPKLAQAIIEHIAGYHLEYNRRVFEAAQGKADIFMMGDDFGMQQGLLISLEMWRKFFRAKFTKFIDLAHQYGLKVMHHTCGSVRGLIPDFIEAGLDILQSIQPQARDMDLAALKREYGRDLCFHGSMDIQLTLPRGSVEDVRQEVQARMAAGKPGGGFIICTAHNLLPDVPLENIIALFEAYHEYG